jgi:hypothetical protein
LREVIVAKCGMGFQPMHLAKTNAHPSTAIAKVAEQHPSSPSSAVHPNPHGQDAHATSEIPGKGVEFSEAGITWRLGRGDWAAAGNGEACVLSRKLFTIALCLAGLMSPFLATILMPLSSLVTTSIAARV